jgi:hypothetical protein
VGNVPLHGSAALGSSVVITNTANGSAVPGTLTWPSSDVMVFRASDNFANGRYIVAVNGDPPAVTSVAGEQLDGDLTPAWPTGDGTPGGNFAFRFSVS